MKINTEMTFLEHLLELRGRLLKVFLSVIIFSILGYIYSDIIIKFLLYPITDPNINLQVLKVTSVFITKITVAVFFGLMVSFPILLYQALIFIIPIFDERLTSLKVFSFIIISLLLLFIGLLFGYYVMIPFSVAFFKNISLNLIGIVDLNYTLENYLVYLIWVLIISSIIYQLPVLIFLLIKIGVIDVIWLKSNRYYIIVGFFILAALFTPPDPISQIMIALPLIALYEMTILIIWLIQKNEKND